MRDGYAFETVAAGQTAQVLGTTGAKGDYIHRLIITPATTTPGVVTLLDGATSIPIALSGTYTLTPLVVNLEMRSASGAWSITTGTNVTVVAVGKFS